jgi:probable HAF family extracellular repeat protein
MSGPRKSFLVLVLLLGLTLLSPAQDAVTTVQLPDGRTTQLTFTTIDVPGAAITVIYGANRTGDLVGYYGDSSAGPKHAFLLRNGVFTFFDYPGATTTVASGINDSGQIVGYAEAQGGLIARGFVYDGQNFTTIKMRNKAVTFVTGINNAGDIVGSAGSPFITRGFKSRDGQVDPIFPPGSYSYVDVNGINSFGVIVGSTAGAELRGFFLRNGRFGRVLFPEANNTAAFGINDDGVIVGWYDAAGQTSAFMRKHGQYVSFSYPGADTYASGINAAGLIVGSYTFDYLSWHGFVASSVALP